MATPLYKVAVFKFTPRAFEATEEQRSEYMRQLAEFHARLGVRSLLVADMSWSNEEFEHIVVEEFPSLDALMEYHDCLRSIGWFGLVDSKTYVGYSVDPQGNLVDFEMPPMPAPEDKPLFKAFLLDSGVFQNDLPEDLVAKEAALTKELGVVPIMGIFTRPYNEAHLGIGLQRYPNEEALLKHLNFLEMNGWFAKVHATTYVGKGTGGLLVEGK